MPNALIIRYSTIAPAHPPMITVGQPITMDPPWAVMSPMRAASRPPIMTVLEPIAITSGGPTHTSISVTRAAGRKPIITVGQQGPAIGPPTCGTKTVTMGHTCMSVSRAASGISVLLHGDGVFLPGQRAGFQAESQQLVWLFVFQQIGGYRAEHGGQFGTVAGRQIDAQHTRIIITEIKRLAGAVVHRQKRTQMAAHSSQIRLRDRKDAPVISPTLPEYPSSESGVRFQVHEIGRHFRQIRFDLGPVQAFLGRLPLD